jgi:hypothetical protein
MRRTKYLLDYEIDRERAKFYRQNSAIIVTDKDDKIANNVYSLDGYYEIDDHHKITVIILDIIDPYNLNKCLVSLVNFYGSIFIRKSSTSNRDKAIVVISPPKSGTHLLLKLVENFGYTRGGILPLQPKNKYFYTLDYDSPHTSCNNFFRNKNIQGDIYGGRLSAFNSCSVVAMFRHPRDVFKSALNYNFDPKNTVFGNYLNGSSRQEMAEALINPESLVGDLPYVLNDMANWIHFPNVLAFAFEEFVDENSKFDSQPVWEMMLHLQVEGDPVEIMEKSFGKSDTFAQGSVFSDDVDIDRISKSIYQSCDYYMKSLGYIESSPMSIFFRKQRVKVKLPIDVRPVDRAIRIDNNNNFNLVYLNKKYHLTIENVAGVISKILFSTISPNTRLHLESGETLRVHFNFKKIFFLTKIVAISKKLYKKITSAV